MTYSLVISGRLPGLNELINAERTNRHKGAKVKADAQHIVEFAIHRQLRGVRIKAPVKMDYVWYEPNRKRDLDNVSSFGRKVIQDALVHTRVLENDGWNNIKGFSDRFEVDQKDPRIEIKIREIV